MKKFLPYILILTIVVQLFAPFSVAPGTKNNLEIKNNKAEAVDGECKIIDEYFTSPNPLPTINTPKPESISYSVETTGCKGKGVALSVHAYGGTGTSIPFITNYREILSDNFLFSLKTGEKYCSGGDCDDIKMSITIRELVGDTTLASKISEDSLAYKCAENECNDEINWEIIGTGGLKTSGQDFSEIKKVKDDSGFPACAWDFWNTIGGCVGIGMYYIFFVPTSFIFGLTGKILDFTFMYSISDEAYRSGFVVQGWGIVRDFCNMFFIFVLLYIAFGTILGLHSVKTKEMIINVVIIGLLINFSLFATQVIIDASNILARVFYNQNTIVTGSKVKLDENDKPILDANGKPITISELGEFNEIKLSEAIVSKVDPQKLVIEAKRVSGIPRKGVSNEGDEGNISGGSFIIVVILATIINIVGMIAFLSAGLIFISRVIGLWLAMIVSPLVFFSYTVPALQDMEMIGWKKWWPETIKLAFLAPVFAFFMYLIIGFMDKGLGVIEANKQNGTSLEFLVAIIVPFVFIMILLIKAKDIAKDMSSKIGQSITNGVAAAGGIALGGAALGAGALLRKGVGSSMAAMSRSDSAKHFDNAKIAHNQALEDWEKKGGATSGSPKPVFADFAPKRGEKLKDASGNYIKNKWTGKDKTYNSFAGNIGNKLNEKQKKVGDVDHARHVIDEKAKAAGVIDKTTGEVLSREKWTYEDEKKVENKFKETERGAAEAAARKGFDSKGKAMLLKEKDENTGEVIKYQGEKEFTSAKRKEISDAILADKANEVSGDWEETEIKTGKRILTKKYNENTKLFEEVEEEEKIKTGKRLTKQGEKKLEDELNIKLNAAVKVAVDDKLNTDFDHIKEEADTKVNPITRGVAGINTTSFDIRKLSDLKSDKRESSLFSKVPIALISGIATGVRAGMKNVGVSNGGIKVEGNFMKDLGSVISDSLKGIKFNVDLSHVGEHKSSADPHGGGGGHH